MSEYSFDSRVAERGPEIGPEFLTEAARTPALTLAMPFEPDSREADALRGAIGFLFALITSYDELMAMDDSAGGIAGGENGSAN